MTNRYNELDVTSRIKVSDPETVNRAVRKIFTGLYPPSHYAPVDTAFQDIARLFAGEYPGYRACDTPYHNIQHTLDTTLAMARLLDGYERSQPQTKRLGPWRLALGIISGLFHDSGYIRSKYDSRRSHGAQYTPIHVSRSGRFVERYLPRVGMKRYARTARQVVYFTGFEKPIGRIRVGSPKDRIIGCILASADLISQMADRSYLERCRDLLYSEFVLAGMTRKRNADGTELVLYESPEDLLRKTLDFHSFVRARLDQELSGVHRFMEAHFNGRNPYLEHIDRNMRYLERLVAMNDISLLRRIPLRTACASLAALARSQKIAA